MGTYVEIRREALEGFLESKHFVRHIHGNEVVYIIEHHARPEVKIKVWTSLPAGKETARGKGEDAIRVTVAWEGAPLYARDPKSASLGLFKAKRIFRTTSEAAVLDRLYDRMREAYEFANVWLRDHWSRLPKTSLPETKKTGQDPLIGRLLEYQSPRGANWNRQGKVISVQRKDTSGKERSDPTVMLEGMGVFVPLSRCRAVSK